MVNLRSRILLMLAIIWLCSPQPALVIGASAKAQVQIKSLSEQAVLDASNRSITTHTLKVGKAKFDYLATAASITAYDKQSKPVGQIFYIAYMLERQDERPRPLTFVFNGGPGAASAYLHLGALGPQRIVFNADGTVPPLPARIVDNPKSWLAFTDLVFVDPIGTGYSREMRYDENKKKDNGQGRKWKHSGNRPRSKVWGVKEDTDSLSRFIRSYLTKENRWLSPLYLAGESYGGLRVARLSKQLQSHFGIAPSGLILISPALDFSFIWGGERSLWPWVTLLPSYAAVAAVHKRSSSQINYTATDPRSSLAQVERIALSNFLSGLAAGRLEQDWLTQTSSLIGLDKDTLLRWGGRVPPARFTKALLADQHRLLSSYDGSITLIDPEPAKQLHTSRDLYLDRLNAPMTAAFNSYVREHLKFNTNLPYLLLNKEVFASWNWRSGIHGQQGFVEAISDLKQAMSMNPDMRTRIVHGVFDLVTPYYASVIIIKQMALDPLISDNIQLKVYHGGHMPYLHQGTLDSMFEDAAQFYKLAP